jgi:hypothetical protein
MFKIIALALAALLAQADSTTVRLHCHFPDPSVTPSDVQVEAVVDLANI